MSKVVIGFYNNISERDLSYQEHIREITNFSLDLLRRYYRELVLYDYIEDTSIDSIIEKAYSSEAEWLYLVAYGLRITDFTLLEKSLKYAEANNCGIIGHPLQVHYGDGKLGENEYLLHPQSFLLNLKLWDKIGKPKFGRKKIGKLKKHIAIRSQENFHDDYTPYWIKPTGTYEDYDGFLDTGWELIQAALDHQEPIYAFPVEVANSRMYMYPENESKDLQDILEGKLNELELVEKYKTSHNSLGNYITETSFKHHRHRIYIYNTSKKIGNDKLNQGANYPKLTNLYAVGSGFKALTLLHQSNWDHTTNIVFYDYSKTTLNLKKWLTKNWDGKDYVNILRDYKENATCDCCEAPVQAIYQWNREVDIYKDEDILRERFRNIVEYFGGMESWLKFWNKFKNLNHEYITCNLLGDYSPLISHMKENEGNNLLWISNIFFSEPVLRNFHPRFIRKQYELLVSDLEQNSLKLEILGSAPPFKYD